MDKEEVRGAVMSACGRYRLRLWRRWGGGARMAFVLLNPSVANGVADDPTLRACVARAQAAGFGGVEVVNLFGWRSADPRALRGVADPVGPGTDGAVDAAVRGAGMVVCGWGNGGALLGRGEAVAARLRGAGVVLHHLGLTKGGAPRHPLYVARAAGPVRWE
ncbi:MAG: DUF1643 domain-containing protein [Gemmobacter sp.]